MNMFNLHVFLCFEEWKRWINKIADVTIRDVPAFLNIQEILDNSRIYRPWDHIADEIGKLQLQTDRPLCLCFGWVEIEGV